MKTSLSTERIAAWPRLTRFYGISPLELARTPNLILQEYIRQLPELDAQEQLAAIQSSGFPHLEKQSDRNEIHRNLVEMADLDIPEIKPAPLDITTGEGRRALHGLGIRVIADPAPKAEAVTVSA